MATVVPTHEEKTISVSSNTNTEEASATENSTENFKAYCYTCDSLVCGKNALDHLFFGILDCTFCSFKISGCQMFQRVYKSNIKPCKDTKTGEHEYKWNKETPDYLSYFKLKELSIERFCSKQTGSVPSSDVLLDVGQYLMSLRALENHQPWKLGFESCRRYPKLALVLSEYEKSSNDKVNESEIKLQLDAISKSLSSNKGCENTIKPQRYNVRPLKGKNDRDCIPAKQLEIEVSESAVEKVCEKEQNVGEENMLRITSIFSIPKSSELVLNANSSEFLNSINNSNESQLRTDLADSSNDGINLYQAKQTSKPSVSDCPLLIPEQNLFDLDDPDEVMLQNCSSENLDETVENVTIDDDRQKDFTPVTEEWESLSNAVNGEDAKEVDTHSAKMKASDMTANRVESKLKLAKKFRKSNHESNFMDFKPPDKISGDHYLVLHYPSQGCPEECPNCYCELCPSMLTVNCSTYVSTIICTDCKLTIYVLPD